MSDSYLRLLANNQSFVEEKLKTDANYFKSLSMGQQPEYLWIGCSDSRVPAEDITGTNPGEIFVHRNIANMVIHSDMNMLSVLSYAVEVLKVKHIIVCGHYGCGGVKAAMGNNQFGLIDNWLRHIKDIYRIHQNELDAIKTEEERFNRLVELNTIEQTYDLCKSSIIQNAWANSEFPYVHAWVYDISTGKIKNLNVTFNNNKGLSKVYLLKVDSDI